MSVSPPPHKAHLWLVGAGPGDPDLITVKGARALGQAAGALRQPCAPRPFETGPSRRQVDLCGQTRRPNQHPARAHPRLDCPRRPAWMAHRSPQRRRPHGVWASRRRTRVCARDRPRLDLRPWHFMRHVTGRAGWHPTDPARRGFVGVAGHGHRSRRSPDLRFAGCPWHSLHPRGVHGQASVAGHRGPFGLPRQVLHPHRRRHTRQPPTATVLCSER